jgi:hypothetical protein
VKKRIRVLLPVLILCQSCSLLWAGRHFETGEYFVLVDQVDAYGDWPVSGAGWFKSDVDANPDVLFYYGDDDVNNKFFYVRTRGDVAGDPIELVRFNSTFTAIQSTSGFVVGEWHHFAFVIASDTSATIWLDGGNSAEDTTSIDYDATTFDSFALGRRNDSSPLLYYDGALAYVATWGSDISASVASLAGGADPDTIDTANRVTHWRLEEAAETDSAVDSEGNYTLAIGTGTPDPVDASTLLNSSGNFWFYYLQIE